MQKAEQSVVKVAAYSNVVNRLPCKPANIKINHPYFNNALEALARRQITPSIKVLLLYRKPPPIV